MRKWLISGPVITLAILLSLAVGLTQAQGPKPPEEGIVLEDVGITAAMDDKIPIQGRLTDDSGTPLNGNYSITARLYSSATGGTPLCTDTDTVAVDNGLFNMGMDYCTSSTLDGRQLYLGIEVESDGEMTPRQPIYAVPYAWSLRPGAKIEESLGEPLLYLYNSNLSGGGGLEATSLSGAGVAGYSLGKPGVYGSSLGGPGVYANGGTGGVSLAAGGNGIITSTAKSYVWISGNDIRPYHEDDGTVIDADTIGGAKIYRGPSAGNKNVMLPITVMGPIYGQDVTISELEIYFVCGTEFEGISAVLMRRQTGVCTGCYETILYDSTDHGCDDAVNPDGCTLSYSLSNNNVLTSDSGIIYLTIELIFTGETSWVEIGGVRLTLEHD